MTLKRYLLRHLAASHPYTMSAEHLHAGIAGGAVHPPPTLTEVREGLDALEGKNFVLSMRDDVDDELRYGLTEAGRMEAKR